MTDDKQMELNDNTTLVSGEENGSRYYSTYMKQYLMRNECRSDRLLSRQKIVEGKRSWGKFF
jgi:hypothetical protein